MIVCNERSGYFRYVEAYLDGVKLKMCFQVVLFGDHEPGEAIVHKPGLPAALYRGGPGALFFEGAPCEILRGNVELRPIPEAGITQEALLQALALEGVAPIQVTST